MSKVQTRIKTAGIHNLNGNHTNDKTKLRQREGDFYFSKNYRVIQADFDRKFQEISQLHRKNLKKHNREILEILKNLRHIRCVTSQDLSEVITKPNKKDSLSPALTVYRYNKGQAETKNDKQRVKIRQYSREEVLFRLEDIISGERKNTMNLGDLNRFQSEKSSIEECRDQLKTLGSVNQSLFLPVLANMSRRRDSVSVNSSSTETEMDEAQQESATVLSTVRPISEPNGTAGDSLVDETKETKRPRSSYAVFSGATENESFFGQRTLTLPPVLE